MNTNMDLVFEVVFNNENSFNNLEANKAKIIVCTYKPAIENKKIIEPIEIEKGIMMCDTAYNITRDMIITAKLTVYKNRMNNTRDEVNYEVDYYEIIDDYHKSSDTTKKKFVDIIISDYLEILKECALTGGEKEDTLMISNYKKLLSDINIFIEKKHIIQYHYIIEEFDGYVEHYVDRMLEIQEGL